jgi:hypothetical protein
MSKHTPGPWIPRLRDAAIEIYHHGPFHIANVYGGLDDDADVGPTSVANADLIAAAPEMLMALLDIKGQCAGHCDEFSLRVWRLADKAIAKAEGKE